MPMLTRTGTIVRKNRRRSSGKQPPRRGSAPTVLQPTSPVPRHLNLDIPAAGNQRYLTPQPSPSKSVSFSFEGVGGVKSGIAPELISVQEQLTASEQQYYGTVVFWNGPLDTDPSYSFLSSLCEASEESTGACDFIQRAFVILGGTWAMTIFLGLLIPLPLAMMAVGVKYLDECPIQPKLPVYLLVGGSFGMIKLILTLCHQVRKMKDDIEVDITEDGDIFTTTNMAHIALNIFLFIWFVFGNYWLFGIENPLFRPPLHEPRNFCDKSVYKFSFWQLIICHILIGLNVFLMLIFLLCYWCMKWLRNSEGEKASPC